MHGTPSTEILNLLQLLNLNGYIIITQNLQFALPLTHGVVHSVVLYKYNDMYPSLWYNAEYFHCPKNHLFCLFILPPQSVANTDLFTILYVCLSQNAI